MELKGSLLCLQEMPLVLILSRMNPLHTLPNYFFKKHSNIIFPFMPRIPVVSEVII